MRAALLATREADGRDDLWAKGLEFCERLSEAVETEDFAAVLGAFRYYQVDSMPRRPEVIRVLSEEYERLTDRGG